MNNQTSLTIVEKSITQNTAKKATTKNINSNARLLNAVIIASLLTAPIATKTIAGELTTSSTLLTTQEQQRQAELNEEIGLGSGLVVGAIIAGPVGAFVTALAGTFIAKHINATDDIEALELALTNEKVTHQQNMTQHQQAFEQKLQSAEQAYQSELLALTQPSVNTGQLQAENLLMSLQFSTGSSEIAPHYQEQVAVLAELLHRSPTMSIDLSGYTDLAGEEKVNHALSLARVQSVKRLLMAQGVEEQRIATFAYGEAEPVVANAEQQRSFYDRRVVLKLHNQLEQTAKN